MVGKILWQQLKFLAECDEAIIETQKNIEILKDEQDTKLYAVEDLEEEIFEKKQLEHEGKKNVALQELYAKELADREDALRQKMKAVTHKKELDALEREMSDLARKQEVHDVVLMKAWSNRDLLLKQLDSQKKVLEEQAQEVKNNAAAYEDQIEVLTKKLQEQNDHRKKMLQGLDAEWRKRYERIKNTVKDPIVALVQNSCGACFYLVASKDLVELKKSHIIICRNCYRFIYYEEVAPAPLLVP